MLKTWDIFDTLIARRCIFPKAVFQIVEQVSRVRNFAAARVEAERRISSRGINYKFDDIYAEFQQITGASKDICDRLKKLEYDVEFDQCIPITENVRQVKSGDILISDMYLPESFIRKLLDKAGLLVPVEIVITNGGKSSGRVWQQLAEQKEFVFHIGDNQNSDVKNPRLAGFESALTYLSNPTPIEQWLLQKDFNFATYLREIRLRNPFTEEIKRIYWQLFTANIGILILLVQQIDAIQKKYGFEYLGFCGRDTFYMRLLYEKYKRERGENPVPNDYLYYSRKLVRTSGEDLAKYFAVRIAGRKALMIDLYGTGTHLHNLRENFNLNFAILICFIMDKKFRQKVYTNMLQADNWRSAFATKPDVASKNESIFIFENGEKSTNLNNKLELLNRALHNSPVRLKSLRIDEKIFPKVIFSENNDTENFDVLENCLREVLRSKIVPPTNASDETAIEMLAALFSVINSSNIALPFRSKHVLIERVDSAYAIVQKK